MPFRTKNKHKASRESGATAAETIAALANIEVLLAASLKDGTIKEGSRDHLEIKREIQKTRNSIGLNNRRMP